MAPESGPRVLLYDDPVFREHDAGRGHPERPERLDAVRRGLRDAGLEARLRYAGPRDATHDELRRVHTAAHVERVAATAGRTVRFDADTQAGPRSYAAALKAAGAAVEAVDHILAGAAERAFCAVRPPGHHAEADRAMGFCLFNNVAVAARGALDRWDAERVLILDWDVHHGNGTNDIFHRDPDVLYVSIHESPLYPGTGPASDTGSGPGEGYTVNLPVPAGSGDAAWCSLVEHVVVSLGLEYRPGLVLLSAGFDAHERDPLGGMRVTTPAFAAMTMALRAVADQCAHGRMVCVTEGGYDLHALAASIDAVAEALHQPAAEPRWPVNTIASTRGRASADAAKRALRPSWQFS
jgi:acetoin utilization deacetylase AcuC-like enzyme